MNRIEKLARAVSELGNHVAAVIRMSNRMDAMLKDAGGELSPQTKDAILRDIADMHAAFRVERFRPLIANVNVASEIAGQLLSEEPAIPRSDEPEQGAETVPGHSEDPGTAAKPDETEEPETPHDEPEPVA